MPQLIMEDKGKIIGMHLSGMTNYCIARVLRISQSMDQVVSVRFLYFEVKSPLFL